MLAPASSAYKHALKEVLSAPGIAMRIKNTKAAREVEALQVGKRVEKRSRLWVGGCDLAEYVVLVCSVISCAGVLQHALE